MRTVVKFILVFVILFISYHSHAENNESFNSDVTDQWNIRWNTLGLAVGAIVTELNYKWNENLVIGPAFFAMNNKKNNSSISIGGLSFNFIYYLKPLYSNNFYIGAFFGSFSVDAKAGVIGQLYTAHVEIPYIGLRSGYHWFWNKINLNIGLTENSNQVQRVLVKDKYGRVVDDFDTPQSSTGLELAIGLLF